MLTSANPDFQLSTDNITFGSTITVTPSGGTILPARPIYKRVTPSVIGSETSLISITSGTTCTLGSSFTDSVLGTVACIYPSAPVGIGFSGTTSTSTSVGFTPASSADGYLVIKSLATFAGGSDPISAHNYIVGDTFGNGRVVGVYTSAPPFTVTGLGGNTNYYLTVIPYNGGLVGGTCGGGPLYSLGTPLSDVATTCPAAPVLGIATSTVNTATINWSSAAGGNALPITYTVEVTTDAGFTAHVIGSPFSVAGTSTSLTVTALNGGVTYYYRVKATSSACASSYNSGTVTTTSYCAPTFTNGCAGGYYSSSISINGYTWNGTLAACGTPNYISTIFSVTAGVAATYSAVTNGYTGNGLWIDFNNDGDFLDAGEQLMGIYSGAAPPVTYSTTFTVGAGVTTGTYRMRIITGWGTDCITPPPPANNGNGPCGASAPGGAQYAYGSYQDFTVYVNNPILTPSITSIPAYGLVPTCSTSAITNFTITGTGLGPAAGNIVGHAPVGMQISTNGTTWDTTVSYAYTGGILATSSVYARYAPTAPGTISGNITFSGGGVFTTPTVTLSGTAGGTALTPTSAAAFGPISVGGTSYARIYSISGSNLTAGNITVSTNNAHFAVSADSITYSTSSYSFANGATLSATPIYINFSPVALGLDTGTITITSPTGCVQTIAVNGYGATFCGAPSLPTALSFFGVNGSSASVGFTPTGSADGYLLARGTAPFVPGSDPVTNHPYIVGDAFGNATIVGVYTVAPPYAATTLTSNTNYYYTVIPYNGGPVGGTCLGGPLYPSGTQLTGMVTTCPGAPTTLTSSGLTSSSAILSWSAPAGGSATTLTYSVSVATDTAFASPITGSPFTASGTSITITGLNLVSTYYYRVSAVGACTSVPSTRATFTTIDNFIPITISSGFNADIIANGAVIPTSSTTFPTGSTSFDNAGYDLIGLPYSYYTSGTVTYSLQASGLLPSTVTSNLKYQLANYTGNNALYLHTGVTGIPSSGTMTFATPVGASVVYIMGISGSGATSVTYTLNYTDGSSEAYPTSYTYPDWFQNTGVNTSICFNNIGRISSTATSTTNSGGDGTYPAFSQAAITVSSTGQTKTIQSVTANSSGAGYLGITAISTKSAILYSSATTLSAFASTDTGCVTGGQSFRINGGGLLPASGSITATAPTGFQVSSDSATWGSTATFAYTGSTMSSTPVYVRFRPTAVSAMGGNITFSGGTIGVSPSIAVSGTGTTFSVAASATSGVFCSTGSPVGLSATGTAASYSWAPSASLDASVGTSVNATPSSLTTYTVTGTNAAGCASKTSTVTVTYNVATGPITGSSVTLCLPGVLALTEAGTGGIWTSSNNTIATVSGTGVVYGVSSSATLDTITYNNAGCGGSATYTLTVNNGGFTVSLTPTSGSYCNAGSAVNITASAPGATAFSWSPSSGLDATTGTVVNATPSASTVYTVIASDGSCSNSSTITVWNITPGVISGGSITLCTTGIGSSTTWTDTTAGGAWSVTSGSVATVTSGGVITPTTPLTAGTVTLAYTHLGCSVTRNLTVNASPSLSTLPASASVCGSVGVTLTASGASTYSWNPSTGLSAATGSTVFATPASSTNYSITGTSTAGCISTTTKSVTVNAGVTASALATSYTVCPGNTTTLIGLGYSSTSATSYTVNTIPYALVTQTSPTVISTFTSGNTDEGYLSTPLPFTFNFFGTNYSNININTNGYVDFSSTPTTTGYSTVTIPSSSLPSPMIALFERDLTGGILSYSTEGTAPNRKFVIYYNGKYDYNTSTSVNYGQIVLYETSNLIDMYVTSTFNSAKACGIQNAGGTIGLSPTSRNYSTYQVTNPEAFRFGPTLASPTYSWTPSSGLSSSTTSTTIATVPSAGTYSVAITNPATGCSSIGTVAVSTYSVPVVAIPTPAIGCSGFAMTATGASTYSWAPSTSLSATTGATVTPTPTVSVIYTVTGASSNGCTATASKQVNPAPSFTITPSSGTVCVGGSVTFSAAGTTSYVWTPAASLSASTGSTVVASPTGSTLYSVVGTDGIGCTSSRTAVMSVNPRPTIGGISASSTNLCTGTTLTLTPVSAAGTGSIVSYNWSGPNSYVYTTTASTDAFVPSTTLASGIYSLSVTYPGFGCTSTTTASSNITVNDLPTISDITASTACVGSPLTLYSGAVTGTGTLSSYNWRGPNAYTATSTLTSVSFTPTSTVTQSGVYSLSVTYPGTGCTTGYVVTSPSVSVNPAIVTGTINGSTTLVTGGDITLTNTTASGGTSVWSSSDPSVATVSASGTTVVVHGVADGTTIISYTTTNPCGTSQAATVSISAQSPPIITSISSYSDTPGASVVITGTNFDASAANNKVRFGAANGTVTAASTTSLTVTVPTGATVSPLYVLNTVRGLSTFSQYSFVPKYDTSYFIAPDSANSVNFLSKVDFTVGNNPNIAAIGDLDGDGKPDLVAVNTGATSGSSPNTISIYKNVGSTGIISGSSFTLYGTFATSNYPQNVKIADLDGDNKPEILVTCKSSSQVSVFHNTNIVSGTMSINSSRLDYGTISAGSIGSGPVVLTVADIDGDGKPDIITQDEGDAAVSYANYVSILRNKYATIGTLVTGGSASFATAVTVNTGGATVSSGSVTTADMDGDGKRDIIVTNQASGTASVLPNNSYSGSISIGAPVTLTLGAATVLSPFSYGDFPTEVQAGDLDGDGKPDLVITNSGVPGPDNFSIFRNTSSGTGSFTFATKIDVSTGSGSQPVGLALADITGDGRLDVVIGKFATGANTVSIFRNISSGTTITLASAVNYTTGTTPAGVVVGDLDGDKFPDIVTANNGTNTISVLKNYPLPQVAPITGSLTVCSDGSGSVTLSDVNTVGGSWSMTNSRATINSVTGLVTGVSRGLDTAVYTVSIRGDVNSKKAYLTVKQGVNGTITATPLSICSGGAVTLNTTTPTYLDPVPPTYTWNGPGISATTGLSINGSSTVAPVNLSTVAAVGAFSVTIHPVDGVCADYTAVTPSVTAVNSQPAISVVAAVNGVICLGNTETLTSTTTGGSGTATYTWSGPGMTTSTSASGAYSFTVAPGASGTYTATISYTDATCIPASNITNTVTPTQQSWVGGTSGAESDWNTPANWSCGTTPVVTDDVVIGVATNVPNIAGGTSGNTRNINILTGASVSLSSTAALNIKGNVANNGTVVGAGKMVLNNTAAQTVGGIGYVDNIELNNAAGATISTASRLTVNGSLTLTSGTLATNDSLVLNSSDTFATARIAPIVPGASVTGKVRVMQYIQGGYRRFRFLSHPFSSNISLGQVEDYIDITGTGGATNGFTTTASFAPSAFWYNPYIGNSTLTYDPGWTEYTNITPSASLSNRFLRYQGIRIFMRGAKGEGLGYETYIPSPTVIGMNGQVNQGSLAITLAKGSSANQEYNMVGNPYPSPVDLGTVLHNALVGNQIVGSAFYVWNPSIGASGNYQAIPINTVSAMSYYMQANTAFQVRADHDGATLNFVESNKSANATNYLFKAQPESVSLYVYDANYHPWDMLYVRFNDDASESEDKYLDATKPMGTDFCFYSTSADNKKMVIDARPYDADKVVPLGLTTSYRQEFIIKAEGVSVPNGGKVYLHDKLLQKYVLLTPGTEYRFNVTKDKATQGDNRFELSMKPVTTVADTKGLQVTMTPNPATDEVSVKFTSGGTDAISVRVLDMSGVSVYNEELGVQAKGTITLPLNKLASGVYMVEFTSGSQKVVQRLIKE